MTLSAEQIKRNMEILAERQHLEYQETVEQNPFILSTPTDPQKRFLITVDRECLFGGAAGGGKSSALLMAALQYVQQPSYNAILFRRTSTELKQAGGLIDRSHEMLDETAARWRESDMEWRFPSGALLKFGYIEYERDRLRYQGSQWQFVGYDELTQFPFASYRYLLSRLRRPLGSDIPIRMRAASNPGGPGHEWVYQRFFREGRRFIPSTLDDNPYIDKAEYEMMLAELDPLERAQLRHGLWTVLVQGELFPRQDWRWVDYAPRGAPSVRYWDLGGTGDPTAGCRMTAFQGQFWVEDVREFWLPPAKQEDMIRTTAEEDGVDVPIFFEQEPGAASPALIDHYARDVLAGFAVYPNVPRSSKTDRARPFSAAMQNHNVYLVRGPWTQHFIDTLEPFPNEAVHDDMVDAASGAHFILTKDRARLGVLSQGRARGWLSAT